MQPSSLIFLVIVAIWAAYLIQHWVRRREHMATARSVDRFSEAMRVLERRSPLPSSELSAPRPHSYAVKPASSRPAVTVKRAVAVQHAPRGVQATAMMADHGTGRSPLAARSASGSRVSGSTAARPTGGRSKRSRSAVLLRKLRGICFLVTLAAIPVTVVLSALHVLLWLSVAICVVAFAAVVVWLRTSVLREQAARAASSSSRRAAHPGLKAGGAAAPSATRAGVTRAAVFDVSAPVAMAGVEQDAKADEVAVAVDREVSLEAGVPGGWSPVPVPPPTYTLKDTATRPRTQPTEVTETPVPIEVDDDDIERMAAERHRRVVGG